MKNSFSKIFVLLFAIIIGGSFYYIDKYNDLSEDIIVFDNNNVFNKTDYYSEEINSNNKDKNSGEENENSGLIFDEFVEEPELVTIPRTYNNKVPFTSQAPYANWSELYNEACEEASIIMMQFYLTKKELNKDIADNEILKMVDWQKEIFNNYFDSNMSEVLKIFKEYYRQNKVKLVTKQDLSVDDLKYYLYNHGPILIPAAGRVLKNKHFRGQGPLYHMLVITGYNKTHFIANDPGTKFGEGYEYKFDIILEAIHDLPSTGKEDILDGEKTILIIDENII